MRKTFFALNDRAMKTSYKVSIFPGLVLGSSEFNQHSENFLMRFTWNCIRVSK